MKDFSKISSPPTNLLKKTTKFECSDECKDVFQELKQRLTIAPMLTLPVEGKEYIIYSDTSKNGLGCVLMKDDKPLGNSNL